MNPNSMLLIGAALLFLGVALGAFGAHGLKNMVDADMLAVWKTGVEYHIYHGLGMLLLGVIAHQYGDSNFAGPAWALLVGVLLFSGSLYAMALSSLRILGAITPLGGVSFLVAWAWLFTLLWKAKSQ